MRYFDWSPDGHLVYADFSRGAPRLGIYSRLTGKTATFHDRLGAEARFSPDGKWIAYVAAGRVVADAFPGPGGHIQVSAGLASQPVWSRDGRRFFYMERDLKLMSVSFDPRTGAVGPPLLVAQTRVVGTHFVGTPYDLAGDGRILINSEPPDSSSPLTVLSGFLPQP